MPQKNLTLKEKILKRISHAFIFAGCALVVLSFVLLYSHFNPNRLSFKDSGLEKQKVLAERLRVPEKLVIKDVNIDLSIFPSTIKNGIWETNTKGVSYLVQSPVPGSYGNSILYGHNWTKLLGPLIQVKPGQEVMIHYTDGTQQAFEVENTAVVLPTDTSILLPSKEPLLTIYTCTGAFDSKRFVVTARRV